MNLKDILARFEPLHDIRIVRVFQQDCKTALGIALETLAWRETFIESPKQHGSDYTVFVHRKSKIPRGPARRHEIAVWPEGKDFSCDIRLVLSCLDWVVLLHLGVNNLGNLYLVELQHIPNVASLSI